MVVLPLRSSHSSKAKTDKDMDEDEQSSIVQSLRGGQVAPLARPLLDDDDATDQTDSVEVLFAETARA